MILRKDMVRLFIISKKIEEKNLADVEDIKIQYFAYLIEYYLNENDYQALY